MHQIMHQNLLTVHGKGRKDLVVPFSLQSSKAIRRYLAKEHRGSPYLIESARGEKLTANSLLQVIYRIAHKAGVTDAHPHRFRHTFAVMFLRQGGNTFVLQRLLGHTTQHMTMRYVNLVTDDLRAAHQQFSPLKGLLS